MTLNVTQCETVGVFCSVAVVYFPRSQQSFSILCVSVCGMCVSLSLSQPLERDRGGDDTKESVCVWSKSVRE